MACSLRRADLETARFCACFDGTVIHRTGKSGWHDEATCRDGVPFEKLATGADIRVLQLFGSYVGTAANPGLRWANPFYTKRKVSVRIRNFETDRLKTGTPARVDRRSVDYSNLEPQPGDEDVRWFSFDPSVWVERRSLR